MNEKKKIVAIRYLKQSGEFIVTTRSGAPESQEKTYTNNLTNCEREWAKASKRRFEDAMSVCWTN